MKQGRIGGWIAQTSQKKPHQNGFRSAIKVNSETVVGFGSEQRVYCRAACLRKFYSSQQSNLFWIIGLGCLAFWWFLPLFLVRYFLAPWKIKARCNALSEGNYDFLFWKRSKWWILVSCQTVFQSLIVVWKTKREREQWLVDISHELALIAGASSELEANQMAFVSQRRKRIWLYASSGLWIATFRSMIFICCSKRFWCLPDGDSTLDIAQLVKEWWANLTRVAEKGFGNRNGSTG